MRICAVMALAWACAAAQADASVLAYDSSDDPAYDDSFPQWDSGDNGGFGFTLWTLSPSANQGDSGFFTATSAQNGFAPSGDIDAPDGDAWGLYANGSASAVAYRGFDFNADLSLDSMPIESTFRIYLDTGWNDANVGFVLRTGNDTGGKNNGQVLEFLHTAGNNYRIIDSSGAVDTGISWTDDGLIFELTLTGVNTYRVSLTPSGGPVSTFNGTLSGSGGIQSIALYNEHAGTGANFDLFFNNMEVFAGAVPEPASLSLLAMSVLLLRALRHRRRRESRLPLPGWSPGGRRSAFSGRPR